MKPILGLCFFSALFCLSGPAAAQASEDTPSEDDSPKVRGFVFDEEYGSLSLGLLMQLGFDVLPNQLEGHRNTFTAQRARLSLSGHLASQNVRYLFSGDAIEGVGVRIRPGGPGAEVAPDEGGQDVPFLLDAKIDFLIPKLGALFTIGRFVPSWGLSMPQKPSDLGAISYPLYVFGTPGSLGLFRKIGLEASLDLAGFATVGGGVFNSGKNSWLDQNDRKDFLTFLTITPFSGLKIRVSSLFTFDHVTDGFQQDGTELENEYQTQILPVLEARYRDYGFDLMAGAAWGVTIRNERDVRENYTAYGFMGHIGYTIIGDWFGLLTRVQWWEPNNTIPKNEQLRLTFGTQILLNNIHSKIAVEYIQDVFESDKAMCETHLMLDTCDQLDFVPEAQKDAGTLLFQFTLDI